MPQLLNTEKNVLLEINLLDNESLDIDISRTDNMNWIPIIFMIKVDEEIIAFSEDVSTYLSVQEIKYLLINLNNMVITKQKKQMIKKFEFVSAEYLFELTIEDCLEDDLIEFLLWFSMGSLTNGNVYGFDKGFRFNIHLEYLVDFIRELEEQFEHILSK